MNIDLDPHKRKSSFVVLYQYLRAKERTLCTPLLGSWFLGKETEVHDAQISH